ncbi:hypothetical protein MBLNU230_g6515t1 [Neophaeotheca triangularis]
MAWEHLSINKPHLVYIILGGFTSIFMLCSSIIKERLYIGEATVATLCGIIFGPHAANLIDPRTWGNEDQITLEFSRIVLVVQCFAVGVELPKAYMERHWKSVTMLLLPVMTFGWLVTSLFIWAMFHPYLNWLESLCCAACVTATDPVLASSVVGKGKFAKRVPKHLRDLLSCESGCNDGMAFPFVYLALYLIRYRPDADEVALEWFCVTILYECIVGTIYGLAIGYIARRLIRYAHEKDLIDRESFLVFYFVLALFCAGSGALLGMDDLLVGFACGVGFSNDGWFTEKTEESHVSNVIDLLINLAFFVYFGTIIPWEQYNSGILHLDAWRLVVVALLVLFFRRIPVMLALKPLIPDIKTWREALFAGHFGPIGVGAIFVAILARAELETGETTPLAEIPESGDERNLIVLIWPIVTFLIIVSIIVHGSSVAVFTLGKHINTLTLSMSYTQANEPSWMDRLPRIASRSKTSMSMQRSDSEYDEKSIGIGNGLLAPNGALLRRQREDSHSRSPSRHSQRRNGQRDTAMGPGGPISQSAIAPASRKTDFAAEPASSDSDTLGQPSEPPPSAGKMGTQPSPQGTGERIMPQSGEIYEEGDNTVFEDEQGNVLAVEHSRDEDTTQQDRERWEQREGSRLMDQELAHSNHGTAATQVDPNKDPGENLAESVKDTVQSQRPGNKWRQGTTAMQKMGTLTGFRKRETDNNNNTTTPKPEQKKEKRQGPARAYQFGTTIIVEDEDGEVVKKYDIPTPNKKTPEQQTQSEKSRKHIGQMGKYLGLSNYKNSNNKGAEASSSQTTATTPAREDDDDARVRFTIDSGGRRMSKLEFIDKIRQMDPKARAKTVEESNAPEAVKREARKESREQAALKKAGSSAADAFPVVAEEEPSADEGGVGGVGRERAAVRRSLAPGAGAGAGEGESLELVDSNQQAVPFHSVRIAGHGQRQRDTPAQRRRQQAQRPRRPTGPPPAVADDDDSEDDGTERVPPKAKISRSGSEEPEGEEAGETAAERRRREGALGISARSEESDSEDGMENEDEDEDEGGDGGEVGREGVAKQGPGIRFADQTAGSGVGSGGAEGARRESKLRWGKDVRS